MKENTAVVIFMFPEELFFKIIHKNNKGARN